MRSGIPRLPAPRDQARTASEKRQGCPLVSRGQSPTHSCSPPSRKIKSGSLRDLAKIGVIDFVERAFLALKESFCSFPRNIHADFLNPPSLDKTRLLGKMSKKFRISPFLSCADGFGFAQNDNHSPIMRKGREAKKPPLTRGLQSPFGDPNWSRTSH